MNEINIVGGANKALDAILAEFNKIDGTQATAVQNGNTYTITVTSDTGSESSMILNIPVLDGPKATTEDDAAALLNEFADKLEELAEELKAIANAENGTPDSAATILQASPATVTFSIYAIIALLQESAAKQRESASNIRKEEHLAVQASLQQEATNIRSTAKTVYSAGLGMAIFNACMTGVSAVMTGLSTKNMLSGIKSSGTVDATKSVNLAKAELKNVTKTASPEVFNGEQRALSVNEARVEATQRISAEGEANTTQNARETLQNVDLESREQAVTDAQDRVTAAENQLTRAKSDLATAQRNNAPDLEAKVKAVTDAEKSLSLAQKDLAQAKVAYADDVYAVKRALDADVKAAPRDDNSAVETRNIFMKGYKQVMVDGLNAKVDVARAAWSQNVQTMMTSDHFARGKNYELLSQSGIQIGTSSNAINQAVQENRQSEERAKEKVSESEQELLRADTESAGDLYDSAKALQQAVIELRSAIEQVDHELAQTIARA